MESIIGLILDNLVPIVVAVVALFLPSPSGTLLKVLKFVRDVIDKVIAKKK